MKQWSSPSCGIEVSIQTAINEILEVPSGKPPVSCILDQNLEIEIIKARVIENVLADGTTGGGRKVVVAGKARIFVKYVAALPEQSVHMTHHEVPFQSLIEWSNGPPMGTPVCVLPTGEFFQVDIVDAHTFFGVVIVRLDVHKVK